MPGGAPTAMYRERIGALSTVSGDGPPVLCLHGTLMDRTMFDPQRRALSDDYRVAAYDLRARTEHAVDPYDLDDLAADCLAAIDALAMDRPVLVGMSMGGFVALRTALAAPDRVAGLVLLDSTALPHSPTQREQYGALVEPLAGQSTVPSPMADGIAESLFGETTRTERPALVDDWIARWKTYRGGAVYNEVHSWLDRPGTVDRLTAIDCPALVVHGAEDAAIPPDLGRQTADALPLAQFETVEDAGHTVNLERPAAVNDHIRRFLDGVVDTH
ncbi:alpha/beta fold hydrolase [Haloarcula sp. GH36]|uniref:alpha/beta fold hydrolase n=1 Tax=Haloarcula montana TaxID=3111776 RepID=UPI002D76F0B6|nr:alpha/beta hydrolase [Haloarcula sp. GH36]